MGFLTRVMVKYKILQQVKMVEAIIEKDDFKKRGDYHSKFYDTFDKDIYKKIAPKLQKLFRDMNDGKLKHTIIVDYSGDVENLKPIDLEMIEALKKLGYEVDELLYKTGHVLKEKKEISILDILKTKATKVRGYDKIKDQYEKTKNQNIKKELDFYDHIIKMKILDSSKKIDIRKLAIYDNKQSKIVFSYNHRLIASQSTNVSWTSCMDFDGGKSGKGGQYSHKVGEGASGGDFVAFLAKAGDEYTLKSPTARVLFKPYFGENTKDVIWKADKTYGTASGFREYAQKIIDKHIKPKPDVYTINPDSYNDGLPTRVFEQLHKLTEDQQLKMVKKNGDVIRHIDNPSTDVQLAAVKQRGDAIEHIKNPSPEVQLEAVKKNGNAIQFFRSLNPSIEVQLAAVKQDGNAIEHIENPSPEVQLEAVKQNVRAIEHIKNPSPEVQLEAVKKNGDAIKHLRHLNPSIEVQLAAVKQNGNAIEHLRHLNPSIEVQLAAVKQRGTALRWLENPSPELQLEAVKQEYGAISYIKNPSLKLQMIAVKQNGYAIQYLKHLNPSPEVQLEAVKQNGDAIAHIENPSPEAQREAVKQDMDAFKYIKNLIPEIQLDIVKQNWEDIKYIKNPSPEAQLEAVKQNWEAIQYKYIKNPSPEAQLEAIKQNVNAIKYLRHLNLGIEVQLEAIKKDRDAIKYIKNPSPEAQLEVVKQFYPYIKDITNPSTEVQLAAVKQNWEALRWIDNPSLDVQLEAIKQSKHGGYALKYIDNPSPEVQLAAVKNNGTAIQYLDTPNNRWVLMSTNNRGAVRVQLAAVKQNGKAIQWIQNPSLDVQLEAVKQNVNTLKYIKNPSPEVLKYVKDTNSKLEAVKEVEADIESKILFLARVEAQCEQNDMSFESSIEFKQAVMAKYKILEKIKSATKSALKKVTLGLVGIGLFSSALMANPSKANTEALKYQNSIQQILKSDGSDLTVNAQAKKLGDKKYVLKIKITDKDSKDYAIIKITKLGDAFQDVELRTNPGPDGDLDSDVEMWGQEVYDSWAASVHK